MVRQFLIENNIPRTNNGIEGRHNIFKSAFTNIRNNLQLIFKKLKDDEEAIRIKKIKIDLVIKLIEIEDILKLKNICSCFYKIILTIIMGLTSYLGYAIWCFLNFIKNEFWFEYLYFSF